MKTVEIKVSEEEKLEIQNTYNRKRFLDELKLIENKLNEVDKKAMCEEVEINEASYQQWWRNIIAKYNLQSYSSEEYNWEFNFQLSKILITKK